MHVLYVVKRFPKVSETFILQEIQELERQGDRVAICSLRTPFPREPRHPGADELAARTLYLPAGILRRVRLTIAVLLALARAPGQAWPALAWALRWAVQDRHPRHLKRFGEACWLRTRIPADVDHIHAHFGHAPATVALLLGRFTGRPFSFTGHANDVFVKPCRGLLRAKIAEASFVAAVAEEGRHYLAETADPRDRSKIVVVRNGVDRSRFTPRSGEPKRWAPLVLCVARLVEIKGLDTLVEACARLERRRVRFRCEIVGEGGLRESLEHLTEERGQKRHLTLVGSRDHEGVRAALDRASVFVLPSRVTESGRRDGLPCVIIEAMAVGVPVVTTPVSGICDVVRDGESGLLVPPGDPEALARAIDRVLSDHGLRARLVRGGWRTAEEFDLEAWVARRRRLFEDARAA
jgi:glycosyltransferase involved in cell wall biosynthesis